MNKYIKILIYTIVIIIIFISGLFIYQNYFIKKGINTNNLTSDSSYVKLLNTNPEFNKYEDLFHDGKFSQSREVLSNLLNSVATGSVEHAVIRLNIANTYYQENKFENSYKMIEISEDTSLSKYIRTIPLTIIFLDYLSSRNDKYLLQFGQYKNFKYTNTLDNLRAMGEHIHSIYPEPMVTANLALYELFDAQEKYFNNRNEFIKSEEYLKIKDYLKEAEENEFFYKSNKNDPSWSDFYKSYLHTLLLLKSLLVTTYGDTDIVNKSDVEIVYNKIITDSFFEPVMPISKLAMANYYYGINNISEGDKLMQDVLRYDFSKHQLLNKFFNGKFLLKDIINKDIKDSISKSDILKEMVKKYELH